MYRALRATLAMALLVGSVAVAGRAQTTITVDAAAGVHPISPYIYGVSYGTSAQLSDLRATINRNGGNNTSRYNWLLNADNRGKDWYFESIADTNATAGYRGDNFIATSLAGGAQPMLTIPTLPWIAKLGANRAGLPSFSVAKYGAQTGVDPYYKNAGNGISSATGAKITGNDPNDANVPNSVDVQTGWINHLVSTWGQASAGGLGFYVMDNEPSIWFATHRDVHPSGASMDEVVGDILSYGSAVKAADPSALVVGPEEWGWTGYLYSGMDQQAGPSLGWNTSLLPDRKAHGGIDYIPYLLQQIAAHDATTGQRTLDVLSVHYYPQSGEYSATVTTSMQTMRNQSTRSLWDPTYKDKSWIGSYVQLIPRLRNWVNTYYPGTKIAITEYNWGAEKYPNGGTAQADVLGIFGREGLDLATHWTTSPTGTPAYNAFKMYRNYDGAGGAFGDTSVSDTVPNPDTVSSFAALRSSDGDLTVMVINKQTSSTLVNVNLANFAGNGAVHIHQMNSTGIHTLQDINYIGSSFSFSAPAQTVTLLDVAPASAGMTPPPAPTSLTAVARSNKIDLFWPNVPTAAYYTLWRLNGSTWSIRTKPTGNSFTDSGLTNGVTYTYKVTASNAAGTGPESSTASATPQSSIVDAAQYNFELSTQMWVASGGMMVSDAYDWAQSFAGGYALRGDIVSPAAGDKQYLLRKSPSTPAGKLVTFHVWIPSGSTINAVQPFVLQNKSTNWKWTGNLKWISSLQTNAWNTITVQVPANAVTPLYEIGVEFRTTGAWSGPVYVDSVSW